MIWPPEGAEPADVADLYQAMAAGRYEHGPAFRGLRAAWRRGADVFAEVALPDPAAAAGFGLHPALFDAALHAAGLAGIVSPPGAILLPFAWTGLALHAAGAQALRVRLRRDGGGLSLAAADATGAPVVSVASLAFRPVTPGQLEEARAGRADDLFTVEWTPVPVPAASGPAPEVIRAGAAAAGSGRGRGWAGGEVARAEVSRVLGLVQEWLAGDGPAGERLAVVTRGAVSVARGRGCGGSGRGGGVGPGAVGAVGEPGPPGAGRPAARRRGRGRRGRATRGRAGFG